MLWQSEYAEIPIHHKRDAEVHGHQEMGNLITISKYFWNPLNRINPQVIFYITDRSNVVLLIWFFVLACFDGSFCTVFTICVSR